MVSCLCPYRHRRLVKVVRRGVVVSVALAAVLSVALPEAVLAHEALAARFSPDRVLDEPAAAVAVVVVELPRVAAVAAPAAAGVAVVLDLQRVHLAAVAELVAPDVRLLPH